MLIDEIIDSLGDASSDLSATLFKVKILLFKIGKKDLAEWVNNEISGYAPDAVIPDYRVIHSAVLANLMNPAYQITSHPIPLGHLKPEQRDHIERSEMREPLATLEAMAIEKEGHLIRQLPMEWNALLSKPLGNGYHVQRAWCEISRHDIRGILVNVRSRLLEFVLQLKDEIGGDIEAPAARENGSMVASLFNNAIFGSHATIVVTNDARGATISTTQSGLEALSQKMLEAGVLPEEVDELKQAVEADKAESGKPGTEKKTGNWLSRMLSKVGTEGRDIAIDTVAKALAEYAKNPS